MELDIIPTLQQRRKSVLCTCFELPSKMNDSDLYYIFMHYKYISKSSGLRFIRAESFALYRLCTPSSYEARVNPHRASDSLRISVILSIGGENMYKENSSKEILKNSLNISYSPQILTSILTGWPPMM